MSFQGIEAGKAFVEFLIKDDKLDSGLLKVADKLKGVGKAGSLAVAPLVATFVAAATVFASTGSELDILSKRTGLSVESLGELKYAADVSGTSLEAIEKAFKKLQKEGVSPEQFDQILADLSQIPDTTERAQKAIDLFGSKTGTQILPLIDSLGELRGEAERLGLVMSSQDAAAAHELEKAFEGSKAQFVALLAQIGAAIAGPLTDFLLWSQGIVTSVIQWVHENPRLVRTIAAVTGAIAAATGGLVTFGVILTIITLHPIVAALTLIAAAVLGIATYFGLASDAGGDFKKQLDGIQTPTNGQAFSIAAQGAQVRSQLQAAAAGGGFGGPINGQTSQSVDQQSSKDWSSMLTVNTQQLSVLNEILNVLKFPPGSLGSILVTGH